MRDFDDWGISQLWFEKICEYLQFVPTVDCFADNNNKKTVRFNSRFYHQNTEAVDCFTQDWAGEGNWVVPPIYLINRAIEYAALCKAEMVLVCPIWKSATFWPTIQRLLQGGNQYIVQKIELGNIFVAGTTENSIFHPANWRGKTLAMHLKFW